MPKKDPDEEQEDVSGSTNNKKRKSDAAAPHGASKKATKTEHQAELGVVQTDKEGKPCLNLSEYRRVTINEYKGAKLVDIRELYKDKESGEMKFGKKGISLNLEQWKMLRSSMHLIDEMLGEE